MKIFFCFCFISLSVSLFWMPLHGDSEIETDIVEKREVKVPEVSDKRIKGYREDYKKVESDKVQIRGSKFRQETRATEKEAEVREIPVPDEEPAVIVNKESVAVKVEENKKRDKEELAPGYYGGVKNGLREGKGTLVLENGDVYRGNWRKGKKSGHGIYLFADGTKYNGSWKNDKMDGQGSLIFAEGSTYYGEFTEGKISGDGTFTYQDGAVYTGMWNDGKWHGEGKFILPDGRELRAVFANHKIVKTLKDGESGTDCSDQDDVCPVF